MEENEGPAWFHFEGKGPLYCFVKNKFLSLFPGTWHAPTMTLTYFGGTPKPSLTLPNHMVIAVGFSFNLFVLFFFFWDFPVSPYYSIVFCKPSLQQLMIFVLKRVLRSGLRAILFNGTWETVTGQFLVAPQWKSNLLQIWLKIVVMVFFLSGGINTRCILTHTFRV